MQPNVENLINAARHLPLKDRQRLVDALLSPELEDPSRARHITEIRGLGKDLWTGADAQDYVNAERDAWET